MKLLEGLKMKGELVVTRWNGKGQIVDCIKIPNLVVTAGKAFIASRMVGVASDVMSHMAVGTNNTAPAVGNTTLAGEVGRVALTTGTSTGAVVTYTATFPAGTGTGALVEAGILNAGSAGTMLCRTTFPVINKGASDTVAVSWTVTAN